MNRDLILPPTRSLGTAAAAALATALVIALVVALVADPRVEAPQKPVIIGVGLLFGLTFATLAAVLARGHGAVWLDAEQRRLGLGITRGKDIWWLPLDRLSGLRLAPLQSGGESIERWLLTLDLRDAPELVLAESDERAFLRTVGENLATRLGLSFEEGLARFEEVPWRPHALEFAIHRGAALQGLLLAFGASLVALGVLALSALEREPIAGFIFGPILLVMGLALAAVSLVKRFARESLAFDGTRFTHGFRFGAWRWAERTIRAPNPRFRIRMLGVRGAILEVLGEDGSLVVASGATARSRMGLPEVAALPRHFQSPHAN
jgi:hypothetical protein